MKIVAMKFFSMIVAGLLMPSLLNAQTLEEIWNLEEPIFNYDGPSKQFIMTFQFSEAMALSQPNTQDQTVATIYKAPDYDDLTADTNCRVQGIDNEYTGDNLVLDEGGIVESNDIEPYPTGRQETIIITLDTDGIAQDNELFTDGDGEATIAFCVRYGLYTGASGGGYEVNFLETIVILSVDLTAGFEVTGVSVAPKDLLERTANQSYELEAFRCTGKTLAGGIPVPDPAPGIDPTPFFQGEVITICIQPDSAARGDNVYMKRIEEMTYVKLDEDGNPTLLTQEAIDYGNPQAGPLGEMYGLTLIDTCEGEVACVVETILFATFYATPGTVSATGTGVMQFGTQGADGLRKLRRNEDANDRSLQATGVLDQDIAESEFDITFQIDQSIDPFALQYAGAGRSSITMTALVGAVMAAMLLL